MTTSSFAARWQSLRRALSPAIHEVQCPPVQALESRRLLSVSMSGDGWTTVSRAPDTHIIYVSSSSGSDANNGLSADAPVQSLEKGIALLRDHSADWLLLKAGDVWNDSLGVWRKSGRSDQEPLLISSYGTGARPLLNTGTGPGFWASAVSNQEIDHVDIIGLHFNADGRDPTSPTYTGNHDADGILVLTKTEGLTVENCQIEHYTNDVVVSQYYGSIGNVSIRRNVITDSYSTDSHSQGMYASGVSNLLIEGNTFDHDGWNANLSNAQPDIYSHDCYLSADNTNVTVRDNIFARASAFGLEDRPGGTVEDNLFIDDPGGMTFGLVNGAHTTKGGVTGIVNGNVFIGGGDLNGAPLGQGILIGNTQAGYPTIVSNNIFADGMNQASAAINLTYGIGQIDPQDSVGLNDLNVEHNIVYNWSRGLYIDGGMVPGGTGLTALNNVNIRDNDFQVVDSKVIQSNIAVTGNKQLHFSGDSYPTAPYLQVMNKTVSFTQWTSQDEASGAQATVPYIDPTRTLAGYDGTLGGSGTNEDFLNAARQQSQQNWQPQYTTSAILDYMRGGLDEAANPHNWTPPTPPIVSDISLPGSVMSQDGAMTFTVTYLDAQTIDTASLSSSNLTVTAKSYSAPAQFMSATGSGGQVTATYSLSAPNGAFKSGKRYKFTVSMNASQVMDSEGFPADAGSLGAFKVRVTPRPKPPKVRQAQLINHGAAIAIKFSSDVGGSLAVGDLTLQSAEGQSIDSSAMTLTWDSAHKTAIWSFNGEPNGVLPAGHWRATLAGATIVDGIGQQLVGKNGNDFISQMMLVKTSGA